jgi:alkylation response protein AidB-like acyl-CoA dehydrogenase
MDQTAENARLPADIDAQPVARAAAELQPELRRCHEEIEREQRFPRDLVGKMREAGLYRMTIPRALGGLELDPITYTRAAEYLAAGCGSVGWNLANNGIAGLVTIGLPEEGVDEIHGQ